MSCFPGQKIAAYFPQAILHEGSYCDTDKKFIFASLTGKLSVSSTANVMELTSTRRIASAPCIFENINFHFVCVRDVPSMELSIG